MKLEQIEEQLQTSSFSNFESEKRENGFRQQLTTSALPL